MSAIAIGAAAAVVGVLVGLGAGYWLPPHGRRPSRDRPRVVRSILLPFAGRAISRRAFEASVRLATAEDATIMPAFLATVPMTLPLETPLTAQAGVGMPLLEALEQRFASHGLHVDARVSRGRSYRDALRHLLDQERFDRIIISADEFSPAGLHEDDLLWLLERVPAEILILRPAPDDTRRITAAGLSGHF
jgi:nucleotide-binding universal stress UspA family protein